MFRISEVVNENYMSSNKRLSRKRLGLLGSHTLEIKEGKRHPDGYWGYSDFSLVTL